MDNLGGNPSFSETPIWAKRKIPGVLDAFVMVQWNMECPQDAFYAENRRIFALPWLWEEGYFLLVTCTFLWMNQTNLADLFWNELTHLETMTPNAKTQKGWRHWCCLNLVLFKPWLRWFRVLGFFAPDLWKINQSNLTICPNKTDDSTTNQWRVKKPSKESPFLRGSCSSLSKLNRIHQSPFFWTSFCWYVLKFISDGWFLNSGWIIGGFQALIL